MRVLVITLTAAHKGEEEEEDMGDGLATRPGPLGPRGINRALPAPRTRARPVT